MLESSTKSSPEVNNLRSKFKTKTSREDVNRKENKNYSYNPEIINNACRIKRRITLQGNRCKCEPKSNISTIFYSRHTKRAHIGFRTHNHLCIVVIAHYLLKLVLCSPTTASRRRFEPNKS